MMRGGSLQALKELLSHADLKTSLGEPLVFEIKAWVCPLDRGPAANASRPGERAAIPTLTDIPGRARLIAMETGHGGSQAA
jgi:hypothetical protein